MSSLWIITGTSSGLGKALAIQAASDDDALVYGIARRGRPRFATICAYTF